jgi:SAM-dependent methyltransferase
MSLVHRLRGALQRMRSRGEGGVASELRFWNEYLAARPPCAASPELRARVFPPALRDCLRDLRQDGAPALRVLELGSGPVSLLGAGVENGWFELVAVDPLATEYAAMMQRHGLAYPVRPVAGQGEALLDVVAQDSFDIAYSGNAIDHAASPFDCVRNLARAVRPGGRIVLEGFCHEGTNAGWEGLHQHDLAAEDGHLVHYDRGGRRSEITAGLDLVRLSASVGPFRDKGVRWFGYEPETPSGGTCGWFDFDWYTLVFEVRS